MSDRDSEKRTFTDKKEADALDKKLEFAENLCLFLESRIEGLDEEKAEQIGLLIADHKDAMLVALKGKPEVLASIGKESNDDNPQDSGNVESIANQKKAG